MAEDIRELEEIIKELFFGKDSAIEKYAKVRHTQYEMLLWRNYGLPLNEVDKKARACFSVSFLNGEKIATASEDCLKNGFNRLGYAVSNGCRGRCFRLVEELNQALESIGIRRIMKPEMFLDWLTFDYSGRLDEYGNQVMEPGFGFPILIFYDQKNRTEFKNELECLLKSGRIMAMQDIAYLLLLKRHVTKKVTKKISNSRG